MVSWLPKYLLSYPVSRHPNFCLMHVFYGCFTKTVNPTEAQLPPLAGFPGPDTSIHLRTVSVILYHVCNSKNRIPGRYQRPLSSSLPAYDLGSYFGIFYLQNMFEFFAFLLFHNQLFSLCLLQVVLSVPSRL